MIYGQILCLGDSLTYGSRDEYGLGYPPLLAEILTEELGQEWLCINKGVPHETTADLLRRVYDVVHSYPECPVVTLLIGTNDLRGPSSLERFERNYRQILRAIRIHDKRIVLGTIPPVNSFGMFCFDQYSVKMRTDYNEFIRQAGELVIEFSNMAEYLIDGVHFGHRGYKEMAKRWARALKSL